MPNLSLIIERRGCMGTIETIAPKFVRGRDETGAWHGAWPSAVGMVRIGELTPRPDATELSPQLLASILVKRTSTKHPIDITELHGVMFFLPLENLKWQEQIETLQSKPSLFEVVPVAKIQTGRDYAFFARRAARSVRSKRKALA